MPMPLQPPLNVRRWCLTGVAGFIGSHLLERLLQADQEVVGLDNFRTGRRANLEAVRAAVTPAQWARFRLVEGDLTHPADVAAAVNGTEVVLHHAALGSVPLSLNDPLATHATNVTGFLHILLAARAAGVRRVVYASSSAVYGDATDLPACEERIGRPLSPYALSKRLNEEYAEVFQRTYGLESVGLRYFNVFGPRQDPAGAYAAVIPRWIDALLTGKPVEIYGDGETTRDFCPVANIVAANLLAATTDLPAGEPWVFNVGLGAGTSLRQLFERLRARAAVHQPEAARCQPVFQAFRPGDVRHSRASTERLERSLGFRPVADWSAAIDATVDAFARSTAEAPTTLSP